MPSFSRVLLAAFYEWGNSNPDLFADSTRQRGFRFLFYSRIGRTYACVISTQRGIFTNTVTMPLFCQDPFNFNVEFSVR